MKQILSSVCSLDISQNLFEVASGYQNGLVTIWNSKSGAFKSHYKSRVGSSVVRVFFSPNESLIFSLHKNGEFLVADTKKQVSKTQIYSIGAGVTCAALSGLPESKNDRKLMAVGNTGGSIKLVDLDCYKVVSNTSKYHTASVSGIAFNQSSPKLMASCTSYDYQVLLSSLSDLKLSQVDFINVKSPVSCLDWFPSGHLLGVGTTLGEIFLYDIRKISKPVHEYMDHKGMAVEEISILKPRDSPLGRPKNERKMSREPQIKTKSRANSKSAHSNMTETKKNERKPSTQAKIDKSENYENPPKQRKNKSEVLARRKGSIPKPFSPLDTQTLFAKTEKFSTFDEIPTVRSEFECDHDEKNPFKKEKKPDSHAQKNDCRASEDLTRTFIENEAYCMNKDEQGIRDQTMDIDHHLFYSQPIPSLPDSDLKKEYESLFQEEEKVNEFEVFEKEFQHEKEFESQKKEKDSKNQEENIPCEAINMETVTQNEPTERMKDPSPENEISFGEIKDQRSKRDSPENAKNEREPTPKQFQVAQELDKREETDILSGLGPSFQPTHHYDPKMSSKSREENSGLMAQLKKIIEQASEKSIKNSKSLSLKNQEKLFLSLKRSEDSIQETLNQVQKTNERLEKLLARISLFDN